jgi:dynein heavy chain
MILVRHGLMIIGDPFAGKTSSYKALAATLSEMTSLKLGDESMVTFATTNATFYLPFIF